MLASLPGLDSAEPTLGWLKPKFPWNDKLKTFLEAENPEIKAWRDCPGSSLLQIIGPPGAGAGNLSACVIAMLLQRRSCSKPRDVLVLSFDFHRFDCRQNTERHLISSFLRQMLLFGPEVYHSIMQNVEGLMAKTPELHVSLLWNLFRSALASVGAESIFLVVHAVHQCNDPGVTEKLAMLAAMQLSRKSVKVLMTSDAPLSLAFPKVVETHQLRLDTDCCWKGIIRSVAEERLTRITQKSPAWYDRRTEILDVLCDNQNSLFGTMLYLADLESGRYASTPSVVESWLSHTRQASRLRRLPLDQVNYDMRESHRVEYTFDWIANSVRPLTTSELAVAVALQETVLLHDEPDESRMVSLVEKISTNPVMDLKDSLKMIIRVEDDEVTLLHHTLRDALGTMPTPRLPHPHETITRQCLQFIKLWARSSSIVERQGQNGPIKTRAYPFLDYALRFWPKHYRLAPASTELDDHVLQFLQSGPGSPEFKLWADHFRSSELSGQEEDITSDPLLLATRLQFRRIVLDLLRHKEHVSDAPEFDRDYAQRVMMLAANWLNDAPVVMHSLYDRCPPRINLGLVLCPASESEKALGPQEDQNHYLLGHEGGNLGRCIAGTQHHWWYDHLMTTRNDLLRSAAAHGSSGAMQALLSSDCIDMLGVDEDGNTTVHIAAKYGAADTLWHLKGHPERQEFWRAIGMENRNGYLPIHLACMAGSREAFDLLFDKVDNDKQVLSSLLDHAIRSGSLEIVEKLVQAGASCMVAGDGHTSSPLQVASELGHYNVVVRLYEEVFEVLGKNQNLANLQEGWEQCLKNSLRAATSNWERKIVEFFSDKVGTPVLREVFLLAIEIGNLDAAGDLISKINQADDQDSKERVRRWREEYLGTAVRAGHVHVMRYLLHQYRNVMPRVSPDNKIAFGTMLVETAEQTIRNGQIRCLRKILRMLPSGSRPWPRMLRLAAARSDLTCLREVAAWSPRVTGQYLRPSDLKMTIAGVFRGRDGVDAKWERFLLLFDCGLSPDVSVGRHMLLHVALKDKAYDTAEVMLQRGADADIQGNFGQTALHLAVEAQDTDAIRLLLKYDANTNIFDNESMAPLHTAIRRHVSIPVVRALLEMDQAELESSRPSGGSVDGGVVKRRANVNLRRGWRISRQHTPLIMAVEEGRDGVVRTLLEAGADPHLPDFFARSPLLRAIESHGTMDKVMEDVRLLLQFGANPNFSGNARVSPLQRAVELGFNTADYIEVVNCLIAAGVDPNIEFGCYRSPLNAAIWSRSREVLEVLIHAGARIDGTPHPFGSPFHLLLLSRMSIDVPQSTEDVVRFSELLIQCGADPNAPDPRTGSTPLMFQISRGKSSLIEELGNLGFDYNMDMTITNDMGQTALHFAASYDKNSGLIQRCLAWGADPLARDSRGHSALYYCVLNADRTSRTRTSWRACFEELLNAIPDEHRQEYLSEVIPAATKTGLDQGQGEDTDTPFATVLGGHGLDLDPNVPDANGWTALDIANELKMSHAAESLRVMGGLAGARKKTPSRWNNADRDMFVVLSEDGMEATLEGKYATAEQPGQPLLHN